MNKWGELKVAFDVDMTLIIEDENGKSVPHYDVITLFKALENFGCKMYIWSGSGMDYAKQWKDKLGLEAEIVAKGSFTPDIAIDDIANTKLGKVNLIV